MKKIIKKILVIILLVICFSINCNAAQIEIVPSKSVLTNITVSNSYLTCRDLDSLNSTLGTTGLDPHLVTNADWGAVSYLANSVYGLDATYDTSNNGRKVTIDGIEFYSTTPNITGVMNWGKTRTQTASLLPSFTKLGDETALKSKLDSMGTDYYRYVNLLIKNKDTRYVDTKQTLGMAMDEVGGWTSPQIFYDYYGSGKVNCGRIGLFGYAWGDYAYESWSCAGQNNSGVTFRPAIWNL